MGSRSCFLPLASMIHHTVVFVQRSVSAWNTLSDSTILSNNTSAISVFYYFQDFLILMVQHGPIFSKRSNNARLPFGPFTSKPPLLSQFRGPPRSTLHGGCSQIPSLRHHHLIFFCWQTARFKNLTPAREHVKKKKKKKKKKNWRCCAQ